MLGGTFFPFLLFACLTFTPSILAEDVYTKRGLAYGNWSKSDVDIWNAEKSPLTWYYNFKTSPSKGVNHYKMQFVPMIWGNNGTFDFYDTVKGLIDSGMDIEYVLGYNEPDICYGGGSCIDAVTAAENWKKQIEPLKKLGVKLGAPAVTGGDFTWLQEFFTACDGGCSTHFIPLHYYATITGLRDWVRNISDLYPNNTIWVTEWACPDCDVDLNEETYNQSIAYLDQASYVERYSYFGAFRANTSNAFLGPNVAMLDDSGGLTDIGTWYFGLPESDVGKKNIGPAATATAAPTPSAANGSSKSDASTSIVYPYWQILSIIGIFSFVIALR